MKQEEIYQELNEIFRDVLDNEEIVITSDSSANDIDEWDSLSHIQLIVAVEKSFGVKFTSREIMKWNNVGEMVESIVSKL